MFISIPSSSEIGALIKNPSVRMLEVSSDCPSRIKDG